MKSLIILDQKKVKIKCIISIKLRGINSINYYYVANFGWYFSIVCISGNCEKPKLNVNLLFALLYNLSLLLSF